VRRRVLRRAWYARDSREVAPELLNKLLVAGRRVGRIVEVEAYVGDIDPGSHAFRGMTRRNATMFGPAGHLYVYFTYGMHWCCNVVCDEPGIGTAVLIRALAPVEGVDEMFASRPKARRERDLCSGPAKLTQALGVDGTHDGADLVTGDHDIQVVDDGTPPPAAPANGLRIGLAQVPGDPNVSR
jgi:DNA-3-methyladenine glycosylase